MLLAIDMLRPAAALLVALNFYHYGDQADQTAARQTPLWQAWLQKRLPAPPEAIPSK